MATLLAVITNLDETFGLTANPMFWQKFGQIRTISMIVLCTVAVLLMLILVILGLPWRRR